ncbi:MAG: prepilin-type N-terminal cleavage/methylation domain-containing protein, partial [candidate division Zixibacteria bacterium]|nr:prepilin-type N-terminal cleavage/methylation domain-containing protein [candidate division Zixibacteria bacterium]
MKKNSTKPSTILAGSHKAHSYGFTAIELMVVMAIISIISSVSLPQLLRARSSANEASAISSLRTCVSSQAMFYQSDLDNDGVYDYATSLEELYESGLIDNVLGTGKKKEYWFHMHSENPDCWSLT